MNLHKALQQCRTARRHGKISSEVQQRTLRRLFRGQDAPEVISHRHYGAMMALRAQIERDVTPKRKGLQEARYALFFHKEDMPHAMKRQNWGESKSKTRPPIDPNLTPEWWREAERRERAEKKLETV